jgi:hypothetical protein
MSSTFLITIFLKRLKNHLGFPNGVETFNSVLKPYEILEVANAQQGKEKVLYWHLTTGDLMKARVVKVLNSNYVLVEERRRFGSLATLIDIKQVISVSCKVKAN